MDGDEVELYRDPGSETEFNGYNGEAGDILRSVLIEEIDARKER